MKTVFILLVAFVAGIAVGSSTGSNNDDKDKIHQRELVTTQIKADDQCEERIHYILLQFNEKYPGIWSTADGPITVSSPRKTKKRM